MLHDKLRKVLRDRVRLDSGVLRRLAKGPEPLLVMSYEGLRRWFNQIERNYLSEFGIDPESLGLFSLQRAFEVIEQRGDIPLSDLLEERHKQRIDRCARWFLGQDDSLVYDLATVFPIDMGGGSHIDSFGVFNNGGEPSLFTLERLTPIGRSALAYLGMKIIKPGGKYQEMWDRRLTAEYGLPEKDSEEFLGLKLLVTHQYLVTVPDYFWDDRKDVFADLPEAMPFLSCPFFDLFPWLEFRCVWRSMCDILAQEARWSKRRTEGLNRTVSKALHPFMTEVVKDFNRWNMSAFANRPIILALILQQDQPQIMRSRRRTINWHLRSRDIESLRHFVHQDPLAALAFVHKFYDQRKAFGLGKRHGAGGVVNRPAIKELAMDPLQTALRKHKVPQAGAWAVRLLNALAGREIYSEKFFEDGPLNLPTGKKTTEEQANSKEMVLHGEVQLQSDIRHQRAARRQRTRRVSPGRATSAWPGERQLAAALRNRRDFTLLQERRNHAGELFRQGHSQADVARRLNVSRQTAGRWHAAWRRGEWEGLRAAGRAGRKSRLNERQLATIDAVLRRGPKAQGYDTDRWTLTRIAEVINRVSGVRYHAGHVWRLVRWMGWDFEKSARRHHETTDVSVAGLVKRRWPQFVKSPAHRRPRSSSRKKGGPN